MGLISTLAAAAGVIVVGGIVLAIEAIEKDNRRKQSELESVRIQYEKENREREAELKRLAKLNDAHAILQGYKQMLDAEAERERAAYSNWKAAKSHMKKLKEQKQCVKRERRKLKGKLNKYVQKKTRWFGIVPKYWITRKRVDLSNDEYVCEERKRLRWFRDFQVSVEKSIRSYAQEKKRVWDAMQIANKQKQRALKKWIETKKEKKFFECVSCGKNFVVTVGQLAGFHERGFQPPKRCPNCRGNHKLGKRG